jgi:hypothetical protein
MIAVIWYLEKSMADGSLVDVDGKLHNAIRGRYGNAFRSVFTKGKNLTNQAHGGMFHLATIARFHIAKQIGATDMTLKAVEGQRFVQFYIKGKGKNSEDKPLRVQQRNMDIILEKPNGGEEWVELKSFAHSRKFQTWKYSKSGGGGAVGKEIVVDRVARVRAEDDGVTNANGEVVSNISIRWLFQKFNVNKAGIKQRSYSAKEFGKNGVTSGTVLHKLSNLASDKEIWDSLKYTKGSKSNDTFKKHGIQVVAAQDGIKTWLKEFGKEYLFKNFDPDAL